VASFLPINTASPDSNIYCADEAALNGDLYKRCNINGNFTSTLLKVITGGTSIKIHPRIPPAPLARRSSANPVICTCRIYNSHNFLRPETLKL
jgi:hypothetical protein